MTNSSPQPAQPHMGETPDRTSQGETPAKPAEELRRQRQMLIAGTIILVLILAVLIGGLILLINPRTDTARVRDIFIIFMALETMFLGVVLVILIIQLARLINLLQNEIKPILDSTNQTVNTLRGTTTFLSDNLVEPVIKMNEYFAGIAQGLAVLGLLRKKKK